MVKQIATPQEFQVILDEAAKEKKTVFVDFTATWCGPCRRIGPEFVKHADALGKDAVFVKVDVDENEDTAGKYEITAMPTFMAFKDGKPVDTMKGADPKGLEAFIKRHL